MIHDPSGASVQWDWQVGTFRGLVGGQWVPSAGVLLTLAEFEATLGVTLSAETKLELAEAKRDHPPAVEMRTVTKLQFASLIRPADLDLIYDAKLGNEHTPRFVTVRINQLLDQIGWASNNAVQLNAPETMSGLYALEQLHYLTAGDADRIIKGLPWQQTA